MNEQLISELMKQSRTEYWTQYTPSYDYEKFAQLIVAECAGIDFRHKIGLTSDQDYEISNTIKQHFGVEQ